MAKEKFNTDEPATKVNRRQFLKFGAGASTGIAIAAATAALEGRSLIDPKQVYAGTTKALDEFPFDIPADYKPFTGQRSIYGRLALGDKSLQAAKESFYAARWNGYLKDGSPGYTVLDGAAARACFAFEYYFQGVNGAGVANKGPFTWHPKVNEFAFRWGDPERNIHSPGVKSAEEGTMAVKKMAKTLGAHSVGIASFDRRFVYNETLAYVDPNPLSVTDGTAKKFIPSDFGFEPKHAIVMTIPMAYEGISCAPTFLGSTQVGLAYAKMGFAAFSLSMFIKDLGYHAVPIGSDTALSIPMAIQAGLGEYSRMGLLVTPDLGPSVRICKVFTDMPLNHDKPISFGVTEFCNSCKKCADQCPAQAISSDAPTTDGPCGDMQNSGIKRWYMDPVKCFSSWGGDNISSCCGACIASCPFTKPEGWHHTLVRSVTGTPGITPIMKNMDDIFGYGKLYDEQAIADWWKK